MNFELLEHSADVGFRARGGSLEELFANCAHALISIILDASNASPVQEWTIEAGADDFESLLVNWLNEVLYYVDAKRVVFASFSAAFPEPLQVRCVARGERRDPERHPVRVSVKGVTYHQLKISNIGSDWMAEVYVDV